MPIHVTPIPRITDLAAPDFTLGTSNVAGSAVTAVSSNSTLLAFDTTLPAANGTAAVGTATVAPRRDHVHEGTALAAPSLTLGTSNSAGGAATAFATNSTILAFDTTLPAANGTPAVGTATVAPRRDHVHAGAALAAPSLTLGTSNSAGGAATAFATNSTILAFDATLPDAITFGQSGAVGSATVASRRDHAHAMEASAGGALTYQGGNTTEATSTSTTAVDLLASSTLNITAAIPFNFISSSRKTTGAVDITCVGLKLNSTVVGEALDDAAHNSKYVWGGRNDNVAGDGGSMVWSGARIANYLQSVYSDGVESPSGAGTGGGPISGTRLNLTANSPTATITSVVLRSIVGNAAITQGSDELHVYSTAVS